MNLICPITDIAPLLPHSGRMVLLEKITAYGADFLTAEAQINGSNLLLDNGVLPCTSGMELMAQGIGAFAGIQAKQAGEPVRLGFLLGTRRLSLYADEIPIGTRLLVKVQLSTQDSGGMGVFDCELHWLSAPSGRRDRLPENRLLAEAALNVYSPKEAPKRFKETVQRRSERLDFQAVHSTQGCLKTSKASCCEAKTSEAGLKQASRTFRQAEAKFQAAIPNFSKLKQTKSETA